MAGIGFGLKKLFDGEGVIRKIRAYAFASIISAGTMILSFFLLICVQLLAKAFLVSQRDAEALIVLMVYAQGGSLLLSSVLQMLLTRFVSDQQYLQAPERVLPSLFGGAIVLMVPGGIAYSLLLSLASEIPLLDRALNWCVFMELIVVWLQMSYITSARNYKPVLLGFLAGVCSTLLLSWILLLLGVSVIPAIMFALFCGYGIMLVTFTQVLLARFPLGSGSLFYFLAWVGKYWDFILIGLFGMAGAYAHLLVMWGSPLGDIVFGSLLHAPTHDTALFYAFLVTLPSNINFVVSIEVSFYQAYRAYFSAIAEGIYTEISSARDRMIMVMRQEISKLGQTQALALVAYAVLMRYFLESIGFTHDMISMFQVMCVGYSAYAVGNCLVLLLLYFNDRKGALLTIATFFFLNLFISLLTRNGPPLFYDLGLIAGGGMMYTVGLLRLLHYVKQIDYHVFCQQPLVTQRRKSQWERWAEVLDTAAAQREQAFHNRKKGSVI